MDAYQYHPRAEGSSALSEGGSSRSEIVQAGAAWCTGALTACALAMGGNTASAQASISDSDILQVTIAGSTPFQRVLTEAQEAAGQTSIAIPVPGAVVNFFVEGSSVSDFVSFMPFTVRLFSDLESTPASGIGIAPFPIRANVTGESATLSLRFSSDENPTNVGAVSDQFRLVLDSPGSPTRTLREGNLIESGEGSEAGDFDLPQIVVSFDEIMGTASDILIIDPLRITITSDSEIPLVQRGNIRIDSESGTVFEIRAVSDIPEPATLTLLAAGLFGLAIVRRRKNT